MCFKFVALALVCLNGLAVQGAALNKRQVGKGAGSTDSEQDHALAESEFLGLQAQPAAAHSGSKYFQYMHMPAKDHYEHGHKQGNAHHFIERHEKGHPHAGEFKNKVRWGDKHGGYGEHYWDYNHAGHGGHESDGEESQHQESYEEFDESKDSPTIVDSIGISREKRQPNDGDVEFINPQARALVLSGKTPKHGGNYKKAPENDWNRPKRHPKARFSESEKPKARFSESEQPKARFSESDWSRTKRQPQKTIEANPHNLIFDTETGHIIDRGTGVHFHHQPIVEQ